MSLDKRNTAILMQLVNANTYLSIEELTERLNVSKRTIYYDISKINNWLEDQGLDKVEQVRSAGFILSDETKSKIPNKVNDMQAWHYEYSVGERKAWITIYILTSEKALYLDDLMEKVRVSRNTTIEDIKSLKEELKKFNLKLNFDRKKGYVILGEEIDIRKAIVYYLSLAVPEPNWHSLLANIQMQLNSGQTDDTNFLNIDTLKDIYNLVSDSERKLSIQFTDDVLNNLSLLLAIFSKRIQLGRLIKMDSVEKEVLRETKAYEAAQNVSRQLEEFFQISFPEDEQFYITTHLLGARVNYTGEDSRDILLAEDLSQVAEKMVDDFQKYACILFQDRDKLVKNLLLHLKPAYYRIKYGLKVENSIVESVKSKYKEVFLLTQKCIYSFEEFLGQSIHDNEIAYIAIHFGGCLRKEGVTPLTRKKAVIVCANGVGTSQILKQQLEGLFSTIDFIDSVSVREYEENDFNVDLVISTTSVTKKDLPTFIVNPILTDAEKEGLLKKVNALFNDSNQQSLSIEGLLGIIQRYADIHDKEKLLQDMKQYLNRPEISMNEGYKPNLTELLTEETICLLDSVKNWQQAISVAAEPLLENGSITQHYISKMIKNVEKFGPYIVISPKIAIPHAKPEDGVKRIGMSFLKLNKAISFSSDSKYDVNFVVVLAPADNESHLKALSQLNRLLSNRETLNKLIKMNLPTQIYQFIKQSITENKST